MHRAHDGSSRTSHRGQPLPAETLRAPKRQGLGFAGNLRMSGATGLTTIGRNVDPVPRIEMPVRIGWLTGSRRVSTWTA